MATEPLERQRLDKWLWAARFFKTRQLAGEAINGGKVHLNGQRTKPGKEVRAGSQLRIHKGSLEWDIEVRVLATQRRPAALCSRATSWKARPWLLPSSSVNALIAPMNMLSLIRSRWPRKRSHGPAMEM